MQAFRRLRQDFGGLQRPLVIYMGVVSGAAVAVAGVLATDSGIQGSWAAIVSLAVIAAATEWRGRIALRGTMTVSISLFPSIFASVLFGPLAGMLVFSASAAGLRLPIPGRLTFAANRALIGAAAGGSALIVTQLCNGGPGQTVAAATAAALAAELADAGFTSIIFVLRGFGRAREALRDLLPVVVASVPFYGPVVAILAFAYREVSPWTLPLFFAPAVAAQRWFLMYQEQRRLTNDLQDANARLQAANLSFAKGLIATLDARDRYTAGHSAAVAIYARDIANRMGLLREQCELAYVAGLVHDIGKVGLPAGLLEKPGALTLDERREMQTHSEIGERILANVETYDEIASIVRHHHERVDGHGYPDGILGEDIPLLSRIIAVADAYNAMTSDRPYRDAMPSRVARLRLAQAVETQFDTSVVAAFEAILAGTTEEYRLATAPEFGFGGEEARSRSPILVPVETADLSEALDLRYAASLNIS